MMLNKISPAVVRSTVFEYRDLIAMCPQSFDCGQIAALEASHILQQNIAHLAHLIGRTCRLGDTDVNAASVVARISNRRFIRASSGAGSYAEISIWYLVSTHLYLEGNPCPTRSMG